MVGRVKETTGRIGELESALQTLQLEHERLEFSLRAKTSEQSPGGPQIPRLPVCCWVDAMQKVPCAHDSVCRQSTAASAKTET